MLRPTLLVLFRLIAGRSDRKEQEPHLGLPRLPGSPH